MYVETTSIKDRMSQSTLVDSNSPILTIESNHQISEEVTDHRKRNILTG